jgi:multidrug resistance efflux pump
MEPDALPPGKGKSLPGIIWEITLIILIIGIVGASIFVSYHWLSNKPKARRRPPGKKAALVQVVAVKKQSHRVEVGTMGVVTPARTVVIAPRVSGELAKISPELVPGGRFRTGDAVAVLDKTDYELALGELRLELKRRDAELTQLSHQLAQRKADVIKADASLRLEEAKAELAKKEYELSDQELDEKEREIVLRAPQLASSKASLASARAAQKAVEAGISGSEAQKAITQTSVRKAELNLMRTEVKAPFNSVVTARSAELGAQVSSGSGLANLVGTDEFWIEISIPISELRWISVPKNGGSRGSEVRIYYETAWGSDVFRRGRVLRLLPELESQGRMARLVVSVEDPLAIESENKGLPQLILNSYVRAVIKGAVLKDVTAVPRTVLRNGNEAWVMGREDKLEIRRLEIVRQERDVVFASRGLEEGERLVVSNLGAAVPGMELRVLEKKPGGPAARRGGPRGRMSAKGPGDGKQQ